MLAGAIAIILATPADAGSEPVRDLIHTTACTEGDSWRFEWRVQLGIFTNDDRAYDFMDDLIARGVAAEIYFTEL
ncbi:MAG: hypothetical protein H0T79_19670, partial [Deltaproteobacteria bacterium]|nr:hypothetical protein [Deltaproteobacteria bacterium]